ncbi:gfo/Idh/MocA family oxidoreductase, partial [Bacillus pumilus]
KNDEELEDRIQEAFNQYPELLFEGHKGQRNNFLMAIKGNQKLLIDGTEGRNTRELITAIYKSANLGVHVKLPLLADDP